MGLQKNEIDFRSLIKKEFHINRIPSDSQEKVLNYFLFLHLCIHSRNIIAESSQSVECLSAAFPSGSKGRFYDGHVRKVEGSTPTQIWLLCPGTRCFTTIIFAWWNLTSSKLKKSEAKFKRKTRKYRQLLSESRFVRRIASPSLSRDRRIKMKKSTSKKIKCPEKTYLRNYESNPKK